MDILPNSRFKLELTSECPEVFVYNADSLVTSTEADVLVLGLSRNLHLMDNLDDSAGDPCSML